MLQRTVIEQPHPGVGIPSFLRIADRILDWHIEVACRRIARIFYHIVGSLGLRSQGQAVASEGSEALRFHTNVISLFDKFHLLIVGITQNAPVWISATFALHSPQVIVAIGETAHVEVKDIRDILDRT